MRFINEFKSVSLSLWRKPNRKNKTIVSSSSSSPSSLLFISGWTEPTQLPATFNQLANWRHECECIVSAMSNLLSGLSKNRINLLFTCSHTSPVMIWFNWIYRSGELSPLYEAATTPTTLIKCNYSCTWLIPNRGKKELKLKWDMRVSCTRYAVRNSFRKQNHIHFWDNENHGIIETKTENEGVKKNDTKFSARFTWIIKIILFILSAEAVGRT